MLSVEFFLTCDSISRKTLNEDSNTRHFCKYVHKFRGKRKKKEQPEKNESAEKKWGGETNERREVDSTGSERFRCPGTTSWRIYFWRRNERMLDGGDRKIESRTIISMNEKSRRERSQSVSWCVVSYRVWLRSASLTFLKEDARVGARFSSFVTWCGFNRSRCAFPWNRDDRIEFMGRTTALPRDDAVSSSRDSSRVVSRRGMDRAFGFRCVRNGRWDRWRDMEVVSMSFVRFWRWDGLKQRCGISGFSGWFLKGRFVESTLRKGLKFKINYGIY